jgi:hypothetical protein
VHATTQRFITRMPPTQPRARRCARAGRSQRFARANLRHNVCRQRTSNLHLGFSVRLTFELSGAWKRAKPAVRCPLERGVGHRPPFGALTFELPHLPLRLIASLCQRSSVQATRAFSDKGEACFRSMPAKLCRRDLWALQRFNESYTGRPLHAARCTLARVVPHGHSPTFA